MTYVSKINNISHASTSKSRNMKIEISAEIYEALRGNKLTGAVEAISPVGAVKIKTEIGNLVISHASFLKVFDKVEISIKKDTLIIEKINQTGESVQLTLKPQVDSEMTISESLGLLNKIENIKKEFELGEYQIHEIKSDDIVGSFLEAVKSLLLDDGLKDQAPKEVFDLSKSLSWSLMFLPLKLDDQKTLARLFIKSFENKKYKNLVLECTHQDLGNCIVLIKLEASSFSSVDLSVITEKEMPNQLQAEVRKVADDVAFNIGFSYKLDFVADPKKANHSVISELLAEYCIGRATNTIA
ncbi:MAG: hypothetical protein LW826_02995 [Candidatus Jidaibacter sp.]|nr:hypothetical protein [Candidatus Jidaibacter sp.]